MPKYSLIKNFHSKHEADTYAKRLCASGKRATVKQYKTEYGDIRYGVYSLYSKK